MITDELIKAAGEGDLDNVDRCLNQGANVNSFGEEPLEMAVKGGHLNVIKRLVEQGATILDRFGAIAARRGHLNILRFFEEQGFNLHGQDQWPLCMGVRGGHVYVVDYLIKQGANLNSEHSPVLRLAIEYGHLDLVKYLTNQGIELDSKPKLYLLEAARNGYLEIVQFLVQSGLKPDLINNEEIREIMYEKGYFEIGKYLLIQSAQPDQRSTSKVEKRIQEIESQVDSNPSLDNQALCTAAEQGKLGAVKYLIEIGANIHYQNEAPLHGAIRYGHYQVAKYLIEQGADFKTLATQSIISDIQNGYIERVLGYLENRTLT